YRPNASRSPSTLRAAAIVITGPGKPIHLIDGQDEHFNMSDGETFWLPRRMDDFRRLAKGRVAVVGSGDTAASIAVALLNALPSPEKVEIEMFCRKGILFPRNEGREDFKWWSDPAGWEAIPPNGKREFIWRTERGVCSTTFKSRIDAAPNVRTLPGMVRQARM